MGLSPSPCLRRVHALEAAGAPTGYRAVLDPAKVGRAFQVLVRQARRTTSLRPR